MLTCSYITTFDYYFILGECVCFFFSLCMRREIHSDISRFQYLLDVVDLNGIPYLMAFINYLVNVVVAIVGIFAIKIISI